MPPLLCPPAVLDAELVEDDRGDQLVDVADTPPAPRWQAWQAGASTR